MKNTTGIRAKLLLSNTGLLAAGLCALACLAGCKGKASEPLRFGINPWPGYEFIHLAQVKGFFKANGVEVQLLDFASLNDNRLGYLRNQIDGMAATQIEMLQLIDQTDRKPVAIFPTDYSFGADMVLAGEGIPDVGHLLHKRVALEPGTLTIFILSRALEKNGLTLDSVTLVPMPQTELPERWKTKAFDAAVCYPPVSVELETAGMHRVFTSKEIPKEVLDILIMDQSVLDSRPDDVRRFLKAFGDAQEFRNTHRAEADSIMAIHMGVTPVEFSRILDQDVHLCGTPEMKGIMAPGGEAERSLGKVHDVLIKVGSILKALPPGRWIRDDFLP